MKRALCIAMILLGVISSPLSHAVAYQGTVANVYPHGGMVYIYVGNGGFSGTSNCPSGSGMVFRFDPSTEFGRTLLAIALSAKLSGLLVYAAGDGNCATGSVFGGSSEGLLGIDLKG